METVKSFVATLFKDNKKAFALTSEYAFLWEINSAESPTPNVLTKGQIIGLGKSFQKLDININEIFASADGKKVRGRGAVRSYLLTIYLLKVAVEAKADGILENGEPYKNSYAVHYYLDDAGKIEYIRDFPDTSYVRAGRPGFWSE
jgi:hypothetical protein